MKDKIRSLISQLEKIRTKNRKIVIMPHFCIDNFVEYKMSNASFQKEIKGVSKRGGGNFTVKQALHLGGKAANLASALSSLGMKTFLIARTSETGYLLLKEFLNDKNIDLSHVSKTGKLSITTAIELKGSNIMMSDPGALEDFGPEQLSKNDKKLIRDADFVSISDWGLNKKGTELAEFVFSTAKKNKKCKTFFDPGDAFVKGKKMHVEITRLYSEIFSRKLADIISLNEDEVKTYGRDKKPDKAVRHLSKYSRLDLHTKDFVKSVKSDGVTGEIPTFKVEPLRLTGAGDAWNAGNIFGEISGFTDEARLIFANAVAAYYISNKDGVHPSLKEIKAFLNKFL